MRGAVRSTRYARSPVWNWFVGNDSVYEIVAVCLDTTSCSVVALDADGEPLRPCLLWMDQRAALQTQEILRKARGHAALKVNCGGNGPISAEWLLPKALWLAQKEPQVYQAAATICEYQDYINFKLTGELCASSCNAASRWNWDGETCILEADATQTYPGRPLSLYQTLGIPELAEKLPKRCLPMGATVGTLTKEAAKHLGLSEGLPVIQGGPDAFVGMLGLGCIHPGQLCLITGSSHLHCVVTSQATTDPGTWGAYRGAPLPGLNFAEGGQSSTGSIIRWARNLFGASDTIYQILDTEAAQVNLGADGLVALETFQGSRTPITDPLARGALIGLTLSHSRAHVWRALMEAVCFGTRACIEGLGHAGHPCDEIILAGGITRSQVWLQMHADVTGKPVIVCENTDAPLLGCAILASVGVGVYSTIEDAVRAMVRTSRRIECDPSRFTEYDWLYKNVYQRVAGATRPIAHAIHNKKNPTGAGVLSESTYPQSKTHDDSDDEKTKSPIIVSPSLLASDWTSIRDEVQRCLHSGAYRLHIDIFDGVFLDSPNALTFGPQMVKAIRSSCQDTGSTFMPPAILDLHVCVDRPGRYVSPMAKAGADRFIFQWEAMVSSEPGENRDTKESKLAQAVNLASEIVAAGMACGVSVNPSTPVEEIFSLLETNMIDVVDILAVEPGFGGQEFQAQVLRKIERLKEWRAFTKLSFDIMVDGGVNKNTARDAALSGADILVAGTFLFQHSEGMYQGVQDLLMSTASTIANCR